MSFLGRSAFGLAPKEEKRMDVVSEDIDQATGKNGTSDADGTADPAGTDSSGDVHQADGVNDGNVTNYGAPAVSAPKVADATSKSAVVQHGPAASRVKP